ncbi:MAG: hypothetical protein IPJ58_13295 [Ardenticatenia bacterium]|nr:hypothetical protein [Ardenticatenia bacterium]
MNCYRGWAAAGIGALLPIAWLIGCTAPPLGKAGQQPASADLLPLGSHPQRLLARRSPDRRRRPLPTPRRCFGQLCPNGYLGDGSEAAGPPPFHRGC